MHSQIFINIYGSVIIKQQSSVNTMSVLKKWNQSFNRLLQYPDSPFYILRFVKLFLPIHTKKINVYQARFQYTLISQLVNLIWKKFFCSRRVFLNNEKMVLSHFPQNRFPPHFSYFSIFLTTFPSLLFIELIFSSCSQLGSVCKQH